MPRLAALVVTFNRLDHLKRTVGSLLAEPDQNLAAVVVVDNASTDGTGAWLAQLSDPRLDVLSLSQNTGGAGGFAVGLGRIRDRHDPDWTVMMDDDARPEPGTLGAYLARPRDHAAAWFGAVYLPDGRVADMNRPWLNPFWHPGIFARSLFAGRDGFHLSPAAYASKATLSVDGGSFVGLFLSREALARAGLPDAGLFIYGDDVLYTLGISASGGKCRFDPALRFSHDCGTLTGAVPTFDPLWKAYYYHRNQLLVYRRAAGPLLFWPVAGLKWIRWRLRSRSYGAQAPAYRRTLSMAVRDGIRRRLDRPHADVVAKVNGSGSLDASGASSTGPT